MHTALFDPIYALMAISFPESELRTYEEQKKLLDHPRYRLCLETDQEGDVIGVLAAWELSAFRFVEHLAVDPGKRSGGIGRRLLTHYLAEKSTPVVLEVEPPAGELEQRRIAFYGRLGFHLNDYPYAQPPLRPGQKPLPLLLMSYPQPLADEQLRLYRDTLYREVYGLRDETGRDVAPEQQNGKTIQQEQQQQQ